MSTMMLNLGMTFDRDGNPAGNEVVQWDKLIPDSHEYLFAFLDADLSQLQDLIKDYLACIEEGKPGNYDTLMAMHKALFELHPYFKIHPTSVDAVLNQLFSNHLNSLDMNHDEKIHAFRLLASTEYAPLPDLDGLTARCEDLIALQRALRRWVFVTLDNTNPAFADLNSAQRNALYYLMDRDQFTPVIDTSVQYSIRPTNRMRRMMAAFEFGQSTFTNVQLDLDDMVSHPTDEVPEGFQDVMDAVKDALEDCATLTYDVHDLHDLLSLEIFDMGRRTLRIKRCAHCGQYFVLTDSTDQYCSRIPDGQSRTCRELHTTRRSAPVDVASYPNSGAAIQAAYRKAYKTHYARIKAGTLTEEDFAKWKGIAIKMKDTVASGEMTLEAYEEWLKK